MSTLFPRTVSTQFPELTAAPTALAEPHGTAARVPDPSVLSSCLLTPRHLPLPPDSHRDGDLRLTRSFSSMFPSARPTPLFPGSVAGSVFSLTLLEGGGACGPVSQGLQWCPVLPQGSPRSPLAHSSAQSCSSIPVSALQAPCLLS